MAWSLLHGMGPFEEVRGVKREQRILGGGEDGVVNSLKVFLPCISSFSIQDCIF